VSQYTTAYRVRYRSLKRLSHDHETHITHGGILVPKSGKLPAINTKSLLRIETPSGAYFDFPARIVREMPGQGFIAAFEPEAKDSQLALDELIITDDFKTSCDGEDDIEGPAVAVSLMDLEHLFAKPAEDKLSDTLDDENAPPLSELTEQPAAPSIKPPDVGSTYAVYSITFTTLLDYQTVLTAFTEDARMVVPHPNDTAKVEEAAELRLHLPGKNSFTIMGKIEQVLPDEVHVVVNSDDPAYQSAISFPRTMRGQKRLASEREDHRAPIKVVRLQGEKKNDSDEKMPLRRRLQRMSMDDKVNLALSGDREARMALASDGNKAIHHYLLKNARISLDEIVMMSRLPTLNPDVLVKIGENPAYTQNPQIVRNLVFNPRTPTKLAVRLIDRLPRNVLNMIAKRTSMHRAIVAAAQKKVAR